VLGAKSILKANLPDFQGEIALGILDLLPQNEVNKCLQEQLNDPSKIAAFFSIDEQLIVGKYFEKMIAFIFYQLPRFKVLHYSKQFFHQKHTIGEIDFILHDLIDDTRLHIEVAVKYYMGFKNIGKHDLWIGPNGRDTLKKKLIKLQDQLKLSDQLELGAVEKRILLLGYFFKHWKHSEWPYFSNDIPDGLWMYEDEMPDHLDLDAFYLIMPKHKWLGFFIDEESSFLSGAELIKEVKEQLALIGKGIMIVQLNEGNRSIKNKLIVVPSKWPKL
jgi:hypothetical protein